MAWQDIFAGNQPGLSDDDKNQLARSGLLQAGLQALAANNSRQVSPGTALAGGLLGGIQSAQQGGQQLVQDRFKQQQQQFQQAQMQDQQQQMQRRQALQDLSLKHVVTNPDGTKTFDQQGYMQDLMQQDPQAGLELQQNQLRTQLEQQQLQKGTQDLNTRDITQGYNTLHQTRQDANSPWVTEGTAPRFAPQQSGSSALAQQIDLLKKYGASDDDIKAKLGIGTATPQINGGGQITIDQVPQADRAIVQQMVDGRYPIPTGKQATDPEWQRRMALANQVDPALDAGTYKARAQARQSFTSGKLGEQVKSLNTLAGHLQTLNDSLDKLDNSNFSWVNGAANVSADFGNSGRASVLGTYGTAAKAVGDEAAKVFAGGSSALGDRQEVAHGLDPMQPNAKLRSTLQTYAELVQSRLETLQNQRDDALGLGSRSLQVVTPKAADTFRKLAGGQGHADASNTPATNNNNPIDPLGIR